jgi:hypothetical protein
MENPGEANFDLFCFSHILIEDSVFCAGTIFSKGETIQGMTVMDNGKFAV